MTDAHDRLKAEIGTLVRASGWEVDWIAAPENPAEQEYVAALDALIAKALELGREDALKESVAYNGGSRDS